MSFANRAVRIAVVGDPGTGKTSLITTAANDTFGVRPVAVLPPTKLHPDFTLDRVLVLLTDTSSKPEDSETVDYVIQNSDAVVVCFDPRSQSSLDNVRAHWYPRIQKLNAEIPIVLACCKADRYGDKELAIIKERLEAVANDLSALECCLNCSARTKKMVVEVFSFAVKAVLYPLRPLYDRVEGRMRQAGVKAFRRVFNMADMDKDGYLSDAELNKFQELCYSVELTPDDLLRIKQLVNQRVEGGLSPDKSCLALPGFLFLQALFIERGKMENVWAALRRFGYDDRLQLSTELVDCIDYVGVPRDQVLELSPAAVAFLRHLYALGRLRGRGCDPLSAAASRDPWEGVRAMLAEAPGFPFEWQPEHVNRLLVAGSSGAAHTPEAFLARWRCICALAPRTALSLLLYMGFGGQPAALLVRKPRRSAAAVAARKRHAAADALMTRTTVFAYVIGPRSCGKTALLSVLAGRTFIPPQQQQRQQQSPTSSSSSSAPLPAPSSAASSPSPSTPTGAASSADSAIAAGGSQQSPDPGAAAADGDAGASAATSSADGKAEVAVAAPPHTVSLPVTSVVEVSSEDGVERTAIFKEVQDDMIAQLLMSASVADNRLPKLPAPSGSPSEIQTPGAAAGASSSSSSSLLSLAASSGTSSAAGPATGDASGAARWNVSLSAVISATQLRAAAALPDLCRCDLAVLAFDASDLRSWEESRDTMLRLCRLPELAALPVLAVACKFDRADPMVMAKAAAFCAEMGVPPPLSTSAALKQDGGLSKRAVSAALLCPDAHVPDTPERKEARRFRHHLIIGGISLAVVGTMILGGVAYVFRRRRGGGDDGAASNNIVFSRGDALGHGGGGAASALRGVGRRAAAAASARS